MKKSKVRDRCHHTGKQGSAAYRICNLRYSLPKKIPVAFKRGSDYVYHFIRTKLLKNLKENLVA